MAFGLTGPCIISLVTPVAATLYGIHNLGALTGVLNLANVPGGLYAMELEVITDTTTTGNLAGPPIGGTILDHSNRNWHALAAYSGLAQVVGMACILYGMFMHTGVWFLCLRSLYEARFKREPRLWAKF